MYSVVKICDHAHVNGGLAKVAISSACTLKKRGVRVIFVAATGPVDAELTANGVEVVCLDQPDMLSDSSALRAATRAVWNGDAARVLRNILSDMNPDRTVVHIHGWSKALSPSILRASYLSAFPVVQTLHDYILVCPNGALFDYVVGENCALKPMSFNCMTRNCDARHFAHKLWRVVRHSALAHFSQLPPDARLILVSEWQDKIVRQHLGKDTRFHLVENPVDVEPLAPVDVAGNDVFLYVGRLSTEKGADLLAHAAARVGARAVFVGDGPVRKDLERQTGAVFTGWLDHKETQGWMRRARALVFPSRWYETFGLTVYEARAHGLPVIVSDNTMAAGSIQEGVTGLRFRSGDIDDLARCLSVLSERDAAAKMGRSAFEDYWSRPLTSDRHADALLQVYASMLDERRLVQKPVVPVRVPDYELG